MTDEFEFPLSNYFILCNSLFFTLWQVIRERQQYHEETGGIYLQQSEAPNDNLTSKKRHAMLDLLIAAMKEGLIDESGIREEVDTFIFEVQMPFTFPSSVQLHVL